MNYRAASLALLALALAPALPAARADIIELMDGRKFTGTMFRNGDVITIKNDDGKTVTAKPGDIAKVTLTSTITPEEAAATDWERIPAQVKAAGDFQAVLDLYQKFLDQHPAAKQADDAKKTLAIYQAMAGNAPVNFRGRWMPRAQVDVVIKQWADAARPALDLYKAGRLKETLDALAPILAADAGGGQNPDALTLAGLAQYRLNNLSAARQQFTALAAADPGSVLAQNNLAVIASQLKQGSFAFYTTALQVKPDQRVLLDNVTEALYAYAAGNGDKTSPAYKALAKAYEPAEARMEETLGKAGLVRWGATWVATDQKTRLQQAQAAIQDYISRLDAQYNSIRNTLTSIQNQIRQTQIDLDNYAATINTCTGQILASQGALIDVSFYVAQRDVATQNYDHVFRYRNQLQGEYNQLAGGTRDYIAQVEKLKSSMSTGGSAGQYTGKQCIIDWGEVDNPPAPPAVADPVVPQLQPPTVMIAPPPAPAPPVLVPMPTGTPVFVPVSPRGGPPSTNRGN